MRSAFVKRWNAEPEYGVRICESTDTHAAALQRHCQELVDTLPYTERYKETSYMCFTRHSTLNMKNSLAEPSKNATWTVLYLETCSWC